MNSSPRVGWGRWLPSIAQVRQYERGWLPRDAGAGLVLVALLVPAGMAYAQASGLPPVTGLYATIVPLLVYALFGPSRILVVGPDSSLTPLIAGVVIPLSDGDPGRAIALAGMLSVIAGLVSIAAGLARLGFLADLLSSPVRYGYLNGIAVTIVLTQLPTILGLDVDADTPLGSLADTVEGVADGLTHGWTVALGAGAFVLMVVTRALSRRVPGALVAMVAAIVVVTLADLGERGVSLVGRLPQGVPVPGFPSIDGGDLGTVALAALGIAFVSFTDTSVLARVYAKRSGSIVDADQELIALGATNFAAGFFQGFPVSGSQSRTPVAEEAGARTQITGVVAAFAVLALILFAPGAVADLPDAALAAVVVVAATKLASIRPVLQLARVRRSDFVLSVAAFVAVLLLGAIEGVGVAIALSLLNVVRRAWMPYAAELVRVDGLKGYHDNTRHPEGHRIPGLLLYRFDAPLFFANARGFHDDVLRRVDERLASPDPVRVVVVTSEPITDIDTTAGEMLDELHEELGDRGVQLRFAELKGQVRDRLSAYGSIPEVPADHYARTTGEAVGRYVAEFDIDWVDWEHRHDGDR